MGMGSERRKTQTFNVSGTRPISSSSMNSFVCSRNLEKSQLGGVIFGCKNSTMKECLSKQLFGLPARHFSYVKNIDPGLPLFLFNYSDRKLHGIFEASSKGQMYMNPYAWIDDCSDRTQYPAQVKIRVRLQCHPLSEDKFGQVIADNYYTNNHFRFELDHRQTSKLLYLLASLAIAPGTPIPQSNMKWRRPVYPSLPSHGILTEGETLETHKSEVVHSTHSTSWKTDSIDVISLDGDMQPSEEEVKEDEKNLIYMKLMELALGRELLDNVNDTSNENKMCHVVKGYPEAPTVLEKKEDNSSAPFEEDLYTIFQFQLMQQVEILRTFKKTQTQQNCYLEHKLMKATSEIQHLKDRCKMMKCKNVETTTIQSSVELPLDAKESLSLKEDFDGESCLSDLYLCSHSQNVIGSLKAVSPVRLYASVVQQLNGEIHVFGGENGYVWYHRVKLYNSILEKWTLCPSLYQNKESLAEVSLNNKIFAVGGVNSVYTFSNDLDNGRWISIRSILDKRFDVAAVEVNDLLYDTNGYSGIDYLKYALCDFDECTKVPRIKLFDPCLGARMRGKLMNHLGELYDIANVKESIYVIGGVKVNENIEDRFPEAIEVV